MRFSPARFVSLAALVPALVLFVLVPGCAKQSEGERCGDPSTANDDCGDGLVCTSGSKLINGGGQADRCCYADGHVTDARCEPNGTTPSGTSTDDAGADASAGAGDGGN